MKMEVKLSAEELETVIGDYLKSRGMMVNSIAYQMKEVEIGVQWDPSKKLLFEGVKCEVELGDSKPKVKKYEPYGRSQADGDVNYDR